MKIGVIPRDLDLLLVELPCRYAPTLPMGIGLVCSQARAAGFRVAAVDANIALHGLVHGRRAQEPRYAALWQRAGGDPWNPALAHVWNEAETLALLTPELDALAAAIVEARPRTLGLSLNGLSRAAAAAVAARLRDLRGTLPILGGGHDCAHPDGIEPLLGCVDYAIIGEAEETLPPLLRRLLAGERPADLPGVVSIYDKPGRVYVPGPLPQELDALPPADLEWVSLADHARADPALRVPVLWSRGCWWGGCAFCTECFSWRRRSPRHIVTELAMFSRRGLDRFQCQDSDLAGRDLRHLHEVADEILRQRLEISLVGQMRCHKGTDEALFRTLRRAGFEAMRFGVDAWSDRLARLQNKGTTMRIVERNLAAARAAGLWVSVNIVVGVPGETEDDIDEAIANLARLAPYIDTVDNFNVLELAVGSRYYQDPGRYGIVIDEAVPRNPASRVVPAQAWHSGTPPVAAADRMRRLRKVALALRVLRIARHDYRIVREVASAP